MNSRSYEYLSHTSEAKFAAYGKTLEEAFIHAALALENIMVDTSHVQPKLTKKLHLKTSRLEALLYDFLQEFLILFDSEQFVLHEIQKLTITKEKNSFSLDAVIAGDRAQHYEIISGVKSATYNEMEISQQKNGWKLVVVLDV